MGDSISSFAHDEDMYIKLCQYFGEKPQTKRDRNSLSYADPYCEHAKELKVRYRAGEKSKDEIDCGGERRHLL